MTYIIYLHIYISILTIVFGFPIVGRITRGPMFHILTACTDSRSPAGLDHGLLDAAVVPLSADVAREWVSNGHGSNDQMIK